MRRFLAVAVLGLLTGCGGGNPNPTPTPTPSPTPEPSKLLFPELLLRTDGVRLVRPNQPGRFTPFGAVQCCMGTLVDGQEINSLWPLASESWMDYTGANLFHFRMGPFYGDAAHETEWTGIGGPYAGSGPEWNPAFWARAKALVEHAGSKGANVEVVVIDTWYCKHAQWGDQEMPWPRADIEACGRNPSAEQERFIRKVVSEFDVYANVVWLTDNEGGEIGATKRSWYEWVASVIRSEEKLAVRLIGTNNTDFADGPFDYVATHARAALTQPIAGKHTENNERNPHFSKEQEWANYCAAEAVGLHYWFWRAELPQADMDWLLAKMRGGCGDGPTACFPPAGDDPGWVEPPVAGGGLSTTVRNAIELAKAEVGERCGTDHDGSLATIDAVGTSLRARGFCAGRNDDALFIRDGSAWKEVHLVSFASGCYSDNPANYPKYTWQHAGQTAACPGSVPIPDELLCHEAQSTNHIWDCTLKYRGQPIRPEGDPERPACEQKACGGIPTFSVDSTTLTLSHRANPYQFKLSGAGTGILHGRCPATGVTDLIGSRQVTQ